jgi:2-keto-4-pentenoate hydratase/2-oxohepta-3-ene-1,7-dioic acid hydratase in catechol pathway
LGREETINMKMIRFEHNGKESYGTLHDKIITPVTGDIFMGASETDEKIALEEVKVLIPIPSPSKIIGLGLNYVKHAEEAGFDIPDEPLLFLMPPSSTIAHLENVVYPDNTERVDYEGELGVVIGKTAKHISEEEALDHVLGYTIINDVSARDYQNKDGQWTRGKGFDTFCPVGPVIATGLDPDNLDIKTRLNGNTVQDSNTNDLIFNIRHQISFISKVMTLLPGDLISTGTPFGVGPLKKGDVVEVEIENIGVLKNFVV